VLIDDGVMAELRELASLAPLHSAPALAVIAATKEQFPELPQFAVFDTAFHSTIPDDARTYALPLRWREEWGIRRYGFHGLSVQWAAESVSVARLAVCHLGAGCSVTAVENGRSVDTSMGFSPLDGVPMATRSGAVDPAVPLHLIRAHGLDPADIERALDEESGLLGLSGISARVEELERSTEPNAQLALTVFVHGIASAVGAMTVALGGLDALVFTGGVGERSARVRAAVCAKLAFLGVAVDSALNAAAIPDADIGAGSVRVVVLHAREDVIAAREARALLAAGG
jgi:acetate kinase